MLIYWNCFAYNVSKQTRNWIPVDNCIWSYPLSCFIEFYCIHWSITLQWYEVMRSTFMLSMSFCFVFMHYIFFAHMQMIMYLLLQFRAIYMQMRLLMETQYHNDFVYNDKNSLFYDYKIFYYILFAHSCYETGVSRTTKIYNISFQ